MPYLDVNQLKVFILDNKKDDTPLLFIHGFLGSISDWIHQYIHFNPIKHTILVDLPGFGRSDKPVIKYSLEFFCSVILSILENLKYNKIILIGQSFGGMIAQQIAVTKPKIVEKLILIDTTYGFCTSLLDIIKLHLVNLFFRVRYKSFLRVVIHQIISYSNDEKKFRIYLNRALTLPKHVVLNTFKNMTLKSNLRKDLSRITSPTLLIYGTKDKLIDKSKLTKMNHLIPSSKMVAINNGPHRTMIINYQEINRIIAEFIKS